MTEQMPPGPELDAAVAERVMGQSPADCTSSGVGGGGAFTDVDGNPVVESWWYCQYCGGIVYGGESRKCTVWPYMHYSTNWAAAGQVVERMEAEGFKLHLDITELGHRCILDKGTLDEYWEHEYRLVGQTGETFPHAISLAALAALETGEELKG